MIEDRGRQYLHENKTELVAVTCIHSPYSRLHKSMTTTLGCWNKDDALADQADNSILLLDTHEPITHGVPIDLRKNMVVNKRHYIPRYSTEAMESCSVAAKSVTALAFHHTSWIRRHGMPHT